MDDVTTVRIGGLSEKEALERVINFAQRFGTFHADLAAHAAFPLVLTPDLLYRIWASFLPQIPWTTVSDILLSSLCREVGYELYEMDPAIRNILLEELREDSRFGETRLRELGGFLRDYIRLNLNSEEPDQRDLAEAQQLTALAQTAPDEAAREIASKLSDPAQLKGTELIRIATLTETLSQQLQDYSSLVKYARGVERLVHGDQQTASDLFDDVFKEKQVVEIGNETLRRPQVEPEHRQIQTGEALSSETASREGEDAQITTKSINYPPGIVPSYFQDRLVETQEIVNFLQDDSQRMMTIVGPAGVGKTTLVRRVLLALEGGELPDGLGALAVYGIVYLSEGSNYPITFANIFYGLCRLLPSGSAEGLDAVYQNPQGRAENKMRALLESIGWKGRVILLLDGFERLLDNETFSFRDTELERALQVFLNERNTTVKIIITTRVAPRSLNSYQPNKQRLLILDEGLESPYAENMLREMDNDGRVGLSSAADDLLQRAREQTRGNPRALEELFANLSSDRSTTLEELLREPVASKQLKVFLSHAAVDKPAVRELYTRLVAEGVDAWLDQEKLLPGQNWQVEIPRAVQDANVVLICLSNESIAKEGYFQSEIKFALDRAEEKPKDTLFLIPVRLEECIVPEALSRWQWVDLFEENGFITLLQALKLRADRVGAVIEPSLYGDEDKEIESRMDQLYTEGLAAFWVEDWDRACQRFQAILRERPNHKNAAEKLAQAERQRNLAKLYGQANEAIQAEDWLTAIKTLEELLEKSTDYKDAAYLLKNAKKQKQLRELYAEAKQLHAAQNWQAVLKVFAQIAALEPSYQDPDNLLASAQEEVKEVQELERLTGLLDNELPRAAIQYFRRARSYIAARDITQAINALNAALESSRAVGREYPEAEKLLKSVSESQRVAELVQRVKSEFNVDILADSGGSEGNWELRTWAIVELDRLHNTIALMANILGGNEKFINNLGGVTIKKADIGSHGGEAMAHQVSLSTKGSFSAWTIVHELAHAWDANYKWALSRELERYTGSSTSTVRSLTLRLTRNWDAGSNGPENKPGRRGRLPGCNRAGYFYGDKPSGSNWNFNRVEDFAESVAMYVGWERGNDLSDWAKARIDRYLLEDGVEDKNFGIDNWKFYRKYFYPEGGDYTKTKRWQFIDDLIKGKISISR